MTSRAVLAALDDSKDVRRHRDERPRRALRALQLEHRFSEGAFRRLERRRDSRARGDAREGVVEKP